MPDTELSEAAVVREEAPKDSAEEEMDEIDVTNSGATVAETVPWGMQHVVGGVVVACFALPFLPVLLILSLACLPAIIFASLVFVMSAVVGPMFSLATPSWLKLRDIHGAGQARHALGVIFTLLQNTTAELQTSVESPKQAVDIFDLPRKDQFLLIFRAFDLDHSGQLMLPEITAVGKALKGKDGWTEQNSLLFLLKLGKNEGDGITPDEFCAFLEEATKSLGKDKIDKVVKRWVHAARRARTPERQERSASPSTVESETESPVGVAKTTRDAENYSNPHSRSTPRTGV